MSCYGDSGYDDPNRNADETKGGGSVGTAEVANLGAGLTEAAVELFLELGEAAAHLMEASVIIVFTVVVIFSGVVVTGVRGREGVVELVELDEGVESPGALGLGEGGGGVGV